MNSFSPACLLTNIFYLWMTVVLLRTANAKNEHFHLPKLKQIYIPGDFLIGGLFSLHITSFSPKQALKSETNACQGTFSRRAYQCLQGMLIAIREINANKTLLPGISLGVDIKDTCGSVDFAVKEALNFSFARKYFKVPSTCSDIAIEEKGGREARMLDKNEKETVAIIGPDVSEIARAVADLAGLFHVPMVSHSATSEVLGDRRRFKHFFRTVPSDTYQTHVIVDLLVHFGWNYVILLASDDEYGRSGQQALRQQLKSSPLAICIVIDQLVTSHNIPQVIRAIQAKKKARVVVLFADVSYVMQIMQESYKQNVSGYTWIASDAWTGARLVTDGNERLLQGMLGVRPLSSYIPGFKKELLRIVLNGSKHDVWAEEFRIYERQMCSKSDLTQCILDDSYEVSPYLGSTIDAVYAVAHALHAMLACSKQRCKKRWADIHGKELVDYLKNVKFRGVSGNIVSFDWFGSGSSSYQIMNLQKSRNGFDYIEVANWHLTNKSDAANVSRNFKWKSDILWNTGNTMPKSVCSDACEKGQRRRPEKVDPQCCWTCIKCGGNTISNQTNMDSCLKCPAKHKPNPEHTQCFSMRDVYMRWNDMFIIIILSLASIGLAIVLLTAIAFIKFRETPIVKAASRGLCCVLLFGVSLLYLLPFTQIGKPTKLMCNSLPFTLGLCLSVNVGTMLVKTNRIARIFSKRIMRRNARFLGTNWQYLMIACIVLVEEAICLLWLLILDPPQVQAGLHIDNMTHVLTCGYNKSLKGLTIWSSYNAGLILVCTYQAFLVRKVPHNYNEAKFIAFTMISTCITILVYIPVHVGAVSYSKDVICSFLYVFVATVELACIFGPKLYIILLRPNKNIPMPIPDSSSFHQQSRFSSERFSSNPDEFTRRKAKRRKLNSSSELGSGQTQGFFRNNSKHGIFQRKSSSQSHKLHKENKSTDVEGIINLTEGAGKAEEIELKLSPRSINDESRAQIDNFADSVIIHSSSNHQPKSRSRDSSFTQIQLVSSGLNNDGSSLSEIILNNNPRKKSGSYSPLDNCSDLLSKSLPSQTGLYKTDANIRKPSSSLSMC